MNNTIYFYKSGYRISQGNVLLLQLNGVRNPILPHIGADIIIEGKRYFVVDIVIEYISSNTTHITIMVDDINE